MNYMLASTQEQSFSEYVPFNDSNSLASLAHRCPLVQVDLVSLGSPCHPKKLIINCR